MDDQEELLQCSDDESLSETEDQCLPIDKPEENYRHTLIYFNHSKLEFITTKVVLILSTAMVLITLPLYVETVNVQGDVYTLIFITTTLCSILFLIAVGITKIFCAKFENFKVFNLPLPLFKLLQISFMYALCGFAIVYAVDRKRVLCHLQDPIKGVVLVCSLIYYFFFCQKFMGLQRIFAATTIIVGLFIAVDYGLCDEFKCRGYERDHVSEDAGNWSWEIHAVWTSVYIGGLALFAGYFTLLEKYLLSNSAGGSSSATMSSSLLSTVSRSVSYPNTNNLQRTRNTNTEDLQFSKKYSSVHLAMWLHVFVLIIVILSFWTDFIPQIGKGSGAFEFFNFTKNGFVCHFQLPVWQHVEKSPCGNVSLYSYYFIFSYAAFAVAYIKFLILSQSAVYTVAVMTAALPVVGIWWSLIHMVPIDQGLLIWNPTISGELICSLLGLPVILLGLFLLCKSHFKDYQWSRLAATHVMSANHFA